MNGDQPLNPVRTLSGWIDQLFTPLSRPIGSLFGETAGQVARRVAPQYEERARQTFQSLGEGFPRLTAEALAYGARKHPLVRLAGIGDVLAKEYSIPGQDLTGALAGTTAFAATPIAGGVGARLAGMVPTAKAFTSQGSKYLATKATERLGSVSASIAPIEAVKLWEASRKGEPYNPLTFENVAGTIGSVLPFEAMHVPGIVKGYRQAISPLVTQVPRSDVIQSHRVDWETGEGPRSRVFNSQDSASMFSDELRKHGLLPVVSPAGEVGRSWVQHEMAWKPEQTIAGGFGLRAYEVLNDMPDKPMPGQQMVGTLRNKLPPNEWEMLPGLEEWVKGKGSVTKKEVEEWVRENGPKVEVRSLEATVSNQETQRLSELEHRFDTIQTNWRDLESNDIEVSWSPENRRLWEEYRELRRMPGRREGNESATSRYTMVNPKPLDQMPGAVDLLVRIPFKSMRQVETEHPDMVYIGPGSANEERGIKYESPHYPTEGKNLVAHVRGYMEATPDGKKVFHVFEVQSDWAQARRGAIENMANIREVNPGDWAVVNTQGIPIGRHFRSREEAVQRVPTMIDVASDPLLKHYESLALKAAMLHAVRNGADAVAISDAETAMMTEGHDSPFNTEPRTGTYNISGLKDYPVSDYRGQDFFLTGKAVYEGGWHFETRGGKEITLGDISSEMEKGVEDILDKSEIPLEVKPEKGMRLHYDRTLPKIAEGLTGEKGKVVGFGEHQNAVNMNEVVGGTEGSVHGPRHDLIFKNPDGSFKTSVTARLYSLDKFKAELAKRGGVPIVGDKYVAAHSKEMQLEGYDPEEIQVAIRTLPPALPNETPLQALAREVGLDPRLFSSLKPEEATEKAFEFLTSMFHYNYGEPVERAAYLARQTMVPLARLSPWMKNTHLASVPGYEGKAKMHGVSHPNSWEFHYLLGVPDIPASKLSARQGPDVMTFEVARALGHEATHNAIHQALNPIAGAEPKQYQAVLRALAQAEAIGVDERKAVLQRMMRLIVPPSKWPEVSKANFEYAKDPEEFLADFASMIAVGSMDGKAVKGLKEALTFGDEASKDFSNAIYRDLTAIWGMVKKWIGFTMEDNEVLTTRVGEVYDNLTSLMRTREETQAIVAGFQGYMDNVLSKPLERPAVVPTFRINELFRRLDKELYNTSESMQLVDEAKAWLRPEETKIGGERLTFWKDFIKPMAQLVETLKQKVPSVMPVFHIALDYRGLSAQLQQETWRMFQTEGKTDWKRLRWIAKDGSPQNRAFSDIALVENVRTQMDDAKDVMTRKQREETSEAYRGLSEEDKEKVDLSLDQMNAMAKFLAMKKWNAFRDRVSWAMTKVIMSYNKNLYHDKAKEFADRAVWAVFDGDPMADQFVANVPIDPKAQAVLKDKIVQNAKEWHKMGDKLLGPVNPETGLRPGKTFYMPEVRVGDWHIAYKVKGEDKPHHEAFKTQSEAARRLNSVQVNPQLDWVKTFNATDRKERFRGMVQEDISAVQQDALDVLYNTTLSAISMEHPEAQDIVDQIKREVQPAAAFANITTSPYMREREFIPGRERLNMVEGMTRYVDASAYNVARSHVKQATIAALFNPDMRANPNVRNEFKKYVDFVTDAQGKEFTLLKNMVFFNYLGFNPAVMVQEPFQQLVALVPYMIENGGGIKASYRGIRGANSLLGKAYVEHVKAGFKGSVADYLKDPVQRRALREAIDRRVVDTGFISDLYGETDTDFASKLSATIGRDGIQSGLDLLKKPMYQLLAVARKAYGGVTAHNSMTAFLATFDQEYSRSKDYDKAMQYASQATYATMYGGGRAARPIMLQRFGSMSGVGGVMYTLGSYSLNTIAMMARLTRKAIMDSTLTGPEKTAAMKAAGVMFVTQISLAGALGLPLVAPGIAVLEQVFPGLDVRLAVRKAAVHLAKLANDDEDMGHLVADGALRGALNLTGVDFGSRFQLANVMGVSPYDGFSWSNVAGPAGNMMENWTKAVGQASAGEVGQAVRGMAPAVLKNVLNLIHNDFAVRDQSGRLIAKMTPGQKAASLIGFKPSKLTNYYEEQRIRQRSEEWKSKQLSSLKQEVAKLMVDGDVASAHKRIMEGLQEVGPYDPYSFAQEAAVLAQDMINPSVRRSAPRVNMAREAEIARLYPQEVGQSEFQRILQSQAMARGVGFGSRTSLSSLRHAALIDQLVDSQPGLTYAEARRMAELMTSRTARQHSLAVP